MRNDDDLVRASGARGAGRVQTPLLYGEYSCSYQRISPRTIDFARSGRGAPSPKVATTAERDVLTPKAAQRGASGPDVNSSQGDYCGADGGDHEWTVGYFIGGERDENGEHTYCRKCHAVYVP